MRGLGSLGGVLGLLLLTGNSVPGGVYNPVEPWQLPRDPEAFRRELGELRGLATDLPNRLTAISSWLASSAVPEGLGRPWGLLTFGQWSWPYLQRESLGLHYLKLVTALEGQQRRGDLTLKERIVLGAFYLRLTENRKAIRVLEPAAKQGSFMLLANLATAYELDNIPERAISYRQEALSVWPQSYAGWDRAQLHFYRRVEKFHLALTEQRLRENQIPGRRGLEPLDSLFPGVQFVGNLGHFEPGEIASEYAAELPPDALEIVMQLLLWLPLDNRLYWLYGELLNARGQVVLAADVFRELVEGRRYAPGRELRLHYRILEEARPGAEALLTNLNSYLGMELLWWVAPRGHAAPGNPSPFLLEAGWAAVLAQARDRAGLAEPTPPMRSEGGFGAVGAPSERVLPGWKTLGIGFALGVVVALLGSQQARQLRRYRRHSVAKE